MSTTPESAATVAFGKLLTRRWLEACCALGLEDGDYITWDIGYWPHFDTERGFGVTFTEEGQCHLRFAQKLLEEDHARQDGIIRHEIGHAIDELVPDGALDRWAARYSVFLAKTPERRADDIARAIWGEALKYDKPLFVQNTQSGVSPRPSHLGL